MCERVPAGKQAADRRGSEFWVERRKEDAWLGRKARVREGGREGGRDGGTRQELKKLRSSKVTKEDTACHSGTGRNTIFGTFFSGGKKKKKKREGDEQ